MAKKFSQFPSASSISPGDSVVGLKDGANTRFSFAIFLSAIQSLFVPTSRKVNNKALTSDITLDASDVGAVDTADVGVADGVASLDSTGKVPSSQLPPISSDAEDITYDPTTSGASATNVQDALDEAFGNLDDKQDTIIAYGILKGDGAGGVSAATRTDYQAPLTAGTDYATPAQLEGKAVKADLTSIQAMGATNTTGAAILAGAYFYLNGILHQAKTQIDVNATFTQGTNCEQVTVGDALFGQFRRDTLYNPGTTVGVATDTTLALSEDYRHYKFVQMVLYNAASATNTTRTILTIPTNDLESRVHYPLAFGSTVGSVSIGVGSTVGTTIRFYASAISPLTLRYIFGLA